MNFYSINPLNNKKSRSFKFHTENQVIKKLELSLESQKKWKEFPVSKKVLCIKILTSILEKNKNKYFKL